jgi:tRNA G18 (ribose-2'-O)-methylase SpoU
MMHKKSSSDSVTVIVLDNLRSHHNVGSIFRTADAFAVEHIYLCGTTPTPIDRFGRNVDAFSKVALGAEKSVPWTYCENIQHDIKELKQKGFTIYAVEQDETSVGLEKTHFNDKSVFIFGAERNGVSKDLLSLSDTIISIEMLGEKESLNVSITAGIVLWEHRGQQVRM